ncbi:MAG: lysophospholipid acyltransferase family protein [Planctomycetota bacterium]
MTQPARDWSGPFDTRVDVRVMMGLNRFFTRFWHRSRVVRPAPRLPDGPFLVTPNHISGLDPALVQSAVPRPIVWMMTAEYYDVAWLRPFLRRVEAIRVDKEINDSSAIRAALGALKAGRVVGIFPEGRLQERRELRPLQPGAVVLAARSGVPMLPVWVDGPMRSHIHRKTNMLKAYLTPHRCRLAVGDFIPAPPRRCDPEPTLETLRAALDGLHTLCR